MAVRIGISVSYLSQIENGDRPVSEAVLVTLAREFPADWGSIDAADDTALLVATLEAVTRGRDRLQGRHQLDQASLDTLASLEDTGTMPPLPRH